LWHKHKRTIVNKNRRGREESRGLGVRGVREERKRKEGTKKEKRKED
jgi:hypothetical protein